MDGAADWWMEVRSSNDDEIHLIKANTATKSAALQQWKVPFKRRKRKISWGEEYEELSWRRLVFYQRCLNGGATCSIEGRFYVGVKVQLTSVGSLRDSSCLSVCI